MLLLKDSLPCTDGHNYYDIFFDDPIRATRGAKGCCSKILFPAQMVTTTMTFLLKIQSHALVDLSMSYLAIFCNFVYHVVHT